MALPTAPSDPPCSSPQPMQGNQDASNSLHCLLSGSDGKTQGDSSQSQLASSTDPTAPDSLSQMNSLLMHTEATEPLQASASQLLSSANNLSQPSTSLHSPPSSSGCPTGGGNESTTQQLPPSSSSHSATPPPFFPQSVLPTFRSAHPPHNPYPAGYNPTTTTWRLPTPQGSPIPSLCSTANSYTQRDWYTHQRTRKERSPHRGSNSRRSPSHSHSKSSKSKSSQSYSCSSSRSGSRSRSRSQSKSRPHSPYSHRRDRHTRSRPSCSYSYGYKRLRSPTPSSSSSPRTGHRSRSKSPKDHSRNHRHRSKGSSSRSCTSRKGERSKREAVTGESNLSSHHSKHSGTLEFELDSERYLQWKKDYTEMCENYFSAYVRQFHQPPLPPFFPMAPHLYPGWDDKKRSKYLSYALNSHNQRVSSRDTLSPSSKSSSCSRSPSQSSSDSRSTGFRSPSASHSSHSRAAKDRFSPTSQSSSDGIAMLSDDGTRTKEGSPSPLTHRKVKEATLREGRTKNKEHDLKNTSKNKIKKRKEEKRKKYDKQEKNNSTISEHDSSSQDKKQAGDASASVQMLLKPKSPTSKHRHGKGKEKRRFETNTEKRKGSEAHYKQGLERQHKERTSEDAGCKSTDSKRSHVDCKALGSGSQKKQIEEEVCVLVNSSENNLSVDPGIVASESALSNRNTVKTERKRQAETKSDIWEGGITVKSQKKISISINLDLKRKSENTDQRDVSCLEEISEKPEDTKEPAAASEEEVSHKGQMGTDGTDKSEPKSLIELPEHIKQEEEKKLCNQNVFTSSNFVQLGETPAEDRERKEEQESILWHYALSGEEENVAEKETVTLRDDQQEQNMGEDVTSSLQPEKDNTSMEQGGEGQRGELQEDEEKTWDEEDPTRFSQRSEDDKTLDEQNSVEDNSKAVVGGAEAEERPEMLESIKTERENPSDQITHSQNVPDLVKISSSKCFDSATRDLRESNDQPDTSPPVLPHLSAGKIHLEIKKDKNSFISRPTKQEQDTGSVFEKDKKTNSTSSGSQRTVSPSNGKDRRNNSFTASKHREANTERDRNREREAERQQEKNRCREASRARDKDKNVDKEGQRSYVTSGLKRKLSTSSISNSVPTSSDMEGRNLQQHESQRRSVSSSTCPDGNAPALRGRGSSTASRSTDWADQRGHKTLQLLRDSSPDWKHKEKYKTYSDFQDQAKIYRHQERAAASQHSPPSRSHSHSKEKHWFETSGESSKQRSTPRKSLNESKQVRDKWELATGDNLVKEGKSRRESHEEGSGRRVAEERYGDSNVGRRREVEEDGRPTTDNSRASAFRESCRMDEKKEKKQRRR